MSGIISPFAETEDPAKSAKEAEKETLEILVRVKIIFYLYKINK